MFLGIQDTKDTRFFQLWQLVGKISFAIAKVKFIFLREGVQQNWFLNSWHPEGLVDLKNVLDFVIWPILDWVIAKLLHDAKNEN